jgi:thiamine pyrophosphokinase
MQAIILANGDTGSRGDLDRTWPGWARDDALVIAADGGARNADRLSLHIDRWVGDGDSLGDEGVAELIARGIPVLRVPTDKDESDTELAVTEAAGLGATEIVVLGALGGNRVDHALANVTLLAHPLLVRLDVRLLAPDARVRLVVGPASMDVGGRIGDLVTLLPLGEDGHDVTTTGLRYPLRGETLSSGRSRGLSNVRTSSEASVAIRRGRLLVVEAPATL